MSGTVNNTASAPSYSEYCKRFIKSLKNTINKRKGPCPAKEFDAMISDFVTNLYSNPECTDSEHPFETEQDAYNFTYSVIFTITSTTSMTYDEFKNVVEYTRLPEQFIHDMYDHIMERKNNVKRIVEQVNSNATKLTEIRNDFEIIKNAQTEEQISDNKDTNTASVKNEPNTYCCVM